jgi:hypothetical protein
MVRNANENPEGVPLKINEHFCKVAKVNRKSCWIGNRNSLNQKQKGR